MAVNEIVTDPELVIVLAASRDARLQAFNLVDHIAAVSSEALLETSKQQKRLITNLAQLRGLHRAANFAARNTKAQTSEARQEVDRLHLQLQNLYYEQRHLQGEIAACESFESVPTAPLSPPDRTPKDEVQEGVPVVPAFVTSNAVTLTSHACEENKTIDSAITLTRSPSTTSLDEIRVSYCYSLTDLAQELMEIQNSHPYQQLPLISEEEFLALKPEHASDDENALMVARIEHERTEREALEAKRMELLKRKQKLIADNKRRKDDLSNLDKELEKFIDSAKPITKLFDKNV